MNLLKPRRTFEAVVRELVAGLEDGTIVLSEEPQPENPNGSLREQVEQVSPHSGSASPQPGEPSRR